MRHTRAGGESERLLWLQVRLRGISNSPGQHEEEYFEAPEHPEKEAEKGGLKACVPQQSMLRIKTRGKDFAKKRKKLILWRLASVRIRIRDQLFASHAPHRTFIRLGLSCV